MKKGIHVLMLVLGCLLGLSVCAAQQVPKEEVAVSHSAGEAITEEVVSLKTEDAMAGENVCVFQ